jgi:lipopolysaccharide transport system permease protein
VPEQWQNLYFLNPMAGIIAAYRDVLIYNRLPGDYLVAAAIVSTVTLLLGYWFFKRVEYQFADII